MHSLKIFLLSIAVLLSGCASGIKHKDMVSAIAPIPAEKARVYFWRNNSMFGSAIQPGIMFDGIRVGESAPGGFFFIDAEPGSHEVLMTTEVERKLTFNLTKGETKYVKSTVGLGVIVYRVYPELASTDESVKELPDLAYTGDRVTKR